jgi:hypothetical protein
VEEAPALPEAPLDAAIDSLRAFARIDPAMGQAPVPTLADKLRDVVSGGRRRRRARKRYRGS